MNRQDLETFLHASIPITRALGARVVRVDAQGSELHAPLNPNRNHLGTAFGGSLHALAVLASYTWLFNQLGEWSLSGHVVLTESRITYETPVRGDLKAICASPVAEDVERFKTLLAAKGKARIELHATVGYADLIACRFTGEFVARRNPS